MLMCLSSQDRDTKDLLKSLLDQIRVSTTLKQFNLLTDLKEEGHCCYKSRSDSRVCYDVVHCKENSRHTNLKFKGCWLMLLPYFTLNAAIVKKLNAAKDDTRRDVNVLGPGLLDIVAAESNSTMVVIIQWNLIEGKTVVCQL
ncbi:hypothetical protein Tco_0850589 [Tanacetum coccineum]